MCAVAGGLQRTIFRVTPVGVGPESATDARGNRSVATIRNRYPIAYWTKLLPIPRGLKAILLRILSATSLGSLNISLNVGNLAAFGYKPGLPS